MLISVLVLRTLQVSQVLLVVIAVIVIVVVVVVVRFGRRLLADNTGQGLQLVKLPHKLLTNHTCRINNLPALYKPICLCEYC